MNTVLLYSISVLFSISQTDVSLTTRTYKFEHSSENSETLTDYIQLTFKGDSVIKGTYYGNEDDYHFISDIKFNTNNSNEDARFSLTEYRYCSGYCTPFRKAKCLEMKNGSLKGEIQFWGAISPKQLELNRTFYYYDSRFDEMLFTLVKEE